MELDIEFDPGKDAINIAKHGISLTRASDIDEAEAVVERDPRDYKGEVRYRAYGLIDGRVYVLVFTLRGYKLRPISLRKANAREQRYAQKKRTLH